MFLMIIPGATGGAAPQVFALIATGLVLTVVHLTGIPVTKVSLNPARSTDQPSLLVDGQSASYGCFGSDLRSVAGWFGLSGTRRSFENWGSCASDFGRGCPSVIGLTYLGEGECKGILTDFTSVPRKTTCLMLRRQTLPDAALGR
jgi:hypothetical protein